MDDCKLEVLTPLTEFEVVRVLDLEDCESLRNVHLANIEALHQLRYLNINGTSVSQLPDGIGQVQHLETLDITGTKVKELPPTIVLLEKLARLFVNSHVEFPAEGFSKMKGLEQLTNFTIERQPLSFLKELGQLTNLKVLEANCNAIFDACYKGSVWRIFTSSLHALCSHKLLEVRIYGHSDWCPFPMNSSFPPLHSLKTFSISPISSLPIWMGSLVNLEQLYLRTKRFTPEDVRVLGGIPALEVLSLHFTEIYAGAFTICRHEFQRLKFFSVGPLCQLLFMPGSMPHLKHLQTELGFRNRDLGIQHLASLTTVDILITALPNHRGGVEDLEAEIRSLLDAHPNRPSLNFDTYYFQIPFA
jgi:hypothetical protein